MKSLAERMGDYITRLKFEDLPANVIQHAKYCLLDALGVAAASSEKPWCRAVLDVVRRHGGAPESVVWFHEDRLPDANAALANAIFVHSMDFNDDLAGIQVGGVIPPTALALAETTRASGKEIITAIVIGYDVATRAAVAINSQGLYMRGLQPTGVCGAFVSAAIAGRLLKMNAAEIASAFGIAASYAGGTLEFLKEGTDTKRFHVAKAAHGGILSAHLAKAGMIGPRTVFDGEFGVFRAYSDQAVPEKFVEELGQRFDILDTSVKLYPFCDGNAAPLEAALAILRENGLKPDDIGKFHFRIKSFLIPYAVDYHGDKTRKYRPQTELDAQMSLPYCLAVGLLGDGRVRLTDFEPSRLSDRRVLELASRVTAEGDAELDKIPLKPMSMPAIATLTTKDGRRFTKRVDYQKGDPRNPFSVDDFTSKFLECTASVVPTVKQQQIVDEVLTLEKSKDSSRLARALAHQRRPAAA